jgi:serpin B
VVDASRRIGTVALGKAPRGANAVVSPASLAVALAMLTEGARGGSLNELEAALGASGDERRDAFAALQQVLLALDGDPAAATADELPDRPIVHRADQVVVDDGFEVHADFLEALADGFDAGLQFAELSTDEGKKVLDAWVKEHTGGLIEESAIQPDPDLVVVLQDALLLAARWQTPFESYDTYDQPFTLPDGSTVAVETMSSAGPEFAFAEVDGWQAVRLPYVEALHADLLLPPDGVDPADATPELLAAISQALDAAVPEPLALSLPTLDIEPDEPLDLIQSGALEALGISSVLSPAEADLSGIAGAPGYLYLGQAFQQAVLKVDEEGTLGAAVTELGVMWASGTPPVGRQVAFNRPFLFTVAHTDSGWPLFMAAVRDPRH